MKRFGKTVAALGVTMAFGAAVAPAAGALPAPRAAELCRDLDEAGVLDHPAYDATRGECVAFQKDEGSINSYWAGVCGFEPPQQSTGTTNKGQCIKALKAFNAG